MKDNRFQKVLAEGRVPVGHMVWEFGTRGIARILDTADLDFVLIDMEHTGFGSDHVADLLAWFRGTDIAPFVRIPQPLYHFIARTMDAGALGVMVPNVESAEAAKQIVDAVKFAPLGGRGVGIGGAHTDYTQPNPMDYFKRSNSNTTVICQIESVKGVENSAAIAAVEGVDVLWVGHFDLTQSMGIPGDFDDPRFEAALKSVADDARKHGKAVGIQPGDWKMTEQALAAGFNVISWKSDTVLFRGALGSEVGELRARLAKL